MPNPREVEYQKEIAEGRRIWRNATAGQALPILGRTLEFLTGEATAAPLAENIGSVLFPKQRQEVHEQLATRGFHGLQPPATPGQQAVRDMGALVLSTAVMAPLGGPKAVDDLVQLRVRPRARGPQGAKSVVTDQAVAHALEDYGAARPDPLGTEWPRASGPPGPTARALFRARMGAGTGPQVGTHGAAAVEGAISSTPVGIRAATKPLKYAGGGIHFPKTWLQKRGVDAAMDVIVAQSKGVEDVQHMFTVAHESGHSIDNWIRQSGADLPKYQKELRQTLRLYRMTDDPTMTRILSDDVGRLTTQWNLAYSAKRVERFLDDLVKHGKFRERGSLTSEMLAGASGKPHGPREIQADFFGALSDPVWRKRFYNELPIDLRTKYRRVFGAP